MKINKFKKVGKNKYKIIFDNTDLTLYEDVILKYDLLIKKEVDLDLIDKIIEEPIEIDEEKFIKISKNIKKEIEKETNKMIKYSKQEIVQKRYEKFRNINNFMEI